MPKPQPLVSIAVCTYNGERYLREQLDSLVSQTYHNIEIIVVDDCSTDDTCEVIADYIGLPNLTFFKNDYNLGYVKNFEKAISFCSGDFIALSDQDDVWCPQKIEILMEHVKGSSLVYHDSAFIDLAGKDMNKKMSDLFNMYQGNSGLPFLSYNCVSGHSLLFEASLRERVLPLPDSFFHDWWIAFIASEHGGISYIDRPLVKYRQHANSVTDIMKLKPVEKKNQVPHLGDIHPARLKIFWSASTKNASYINALLGCLGEFGESRSRGYLFFLLLKRYRELFFHKKRAI